MKRKLLPLIFIITLSLILSGVFFEPNKQLLAQTNQCSLKKLELQMPQAETLNSLSTTNGETFTFTDNDIHFYNITNEIPKTIEFKNLNNHESTSTNIGLKMRNNISFIFSTTEYNNNNKTYGLYKILENGKVATTEPYQKVYKLFEDDNYYYEISQVSDMCFDYYNNLYMLDASNKAILTFKYENMENHEQNRITIFKDLNLPELEIYSLINENSKMCITHNGENIFLLTQNKLFNLNTQTKELKTIELSSNIDLNNVTDFSCDCAGNLYFLLNNSICKQSKNLGTTFINFSDNNFDEFYIEQFSGRLFLKEDKNIYELMFDNYFVSSTTYFPEPINVNSKEFLSAPATFAKTNENCKLLSSPYSLECDTILSENSVVLVFQNPILEEPEFAYCLFEQNNQLTLGYIKTNSFKEYSTYTKKENTFKKTFVVTNVYKYPTKNLAKLTTIKEDCIIEILGEHCFSENESNINFYCVKITENNQSYLGYIDKDLAYALSTEEIVYTGGETTPDKYDKFIEYLLIILALVVLEIVTITIIVKKVGIKKTSDK